MNIGRSFATLAFGALIFLTSCGQQPEHSDADANATSSTTRQTTAESTKVQGQLEHDIQTDATAPTNVIHTFGTTTTKPTNAAAPDDGTASVFTFSSRNYTDVFPKTSRTTTSTTTTTQTTQSVYAWYDDLNAEFEAYGGYTCLQLSNHEIFSYRNKIYGLHKADGVSHVFSVDENNNGRIVASAENLRGVYFQDGIFYLYGANADVAETEWVQRVPADGALEGAFLEFCELPRYAYRSFPDSYHYPRFEAPASNGRFIVSERNERETGVGWETRLYLVDSDYQHKLRLTTPEPNCFYDFIGSYQNKLYFRVKDYDSHLSESIFYLDVKLKTWHNLTGQITFSHSSYCIGKYLFLPLQAYNMEKDSTWFRLYEYTPYPFGKYSYFGGNYHIDSAGDGYQIASDTSAEAVSIGKKRYVEVDQSGVFVHTFENGVDTEHTVLLWD